MDEKFQESIEGLEANGWVAFTKKISSKLIVSELSKRNLVSYTAVANIIFPSKQSIYRKSLSKLYGFNAFPLHTDGAQDRTPPNYLILQRNKAFSGATKTYLFDSYELFETIPGLGEKMFLLKGNGFNEITPLRKTLNDKILFRYNPVIMKTTSKKTREVLENFFSNASKIAIDWNSTETLIIDNWRMLHSRGEVKGDDKDRVLERISLYIK